MARMVQRLLVLNAAIWHNWLIGQAAPDRIRPLLTGPSSRFTR